MVCARRVQVADAVAARAQLSIAQSRDRVVGGRGVGVVAEGLERRQVALLHPLLRAGEVAVADLALRLLLELDHDHDVQRLQPEVHDVVVVEGDAVAVLARRLHLRDRKEQSHRENCQHQDQHAVLHCKVCCGAVLWRRACVAAVGGESC